MTRALEALHRAALDALYPQGNLCHLCGQPALRQDEAVLCEACAGALRASFLQVDEARVAVRDALTAARAAFAYEGEAMRLVRALKYHSDALCALPLAWGMARAFCEDEALRRAEVIVPVPMHPSRLRARGYNQAELLARALQETLSLPLDTETLCRVKRNRSQIGLHRNARLRNLAGSFKARGDALRGRHVLLIDDVRTTGATAEACALALVRGGAKSVCLLTACGA